MAGHHCKLQMAAAKGHLPVVRYLKGEVQQCSSCDKACELKCSLCHAAFYCNAECQKKAWKAHRQQAAVHGLQEEVKEVRRV